ncbi:MAG: HEAT repeat domain-containing protein, partial [Myxococcales bacterium]|nr:HEAT repeat domain-containing protein [Myxococcales bacterium]
AAVAGRLADEQPEVRFQAVIAYPRVAARAEAIAALVAATEDDDPLIRHIALRMAEEVGGEQPDDSVDDALLERARALLDDPATVVQVAAAIVLGRAGRRDGAALLADVVNGEITTSEAEDEAAAVELCGELRIKAARDGLRKRAFSGGWLTRRDTFAWQARVALAQLGNARAERWILSELTAFTRERRCLAVEAVARARLPAARPLLEAMRGDPARAEPEAVQKALAALDADGD